MTDERRNYLSKLLAGVAIGVTTMMGIYAVAATSASSVAASFVTGESTQRTRITEFAVAVKRASVDQREARAKCRIIHGDKKTDCNALARAEERRAVERARSRWSGTSGQT